MRWCRGIVLVVEEKMVVEMQKGCVKVVKASRYDSPVFSVGTIVGYV